MMTKQDCIEFAVSSAYMAFDQAGAYGGLQNSIDSHRDNVRDTLNEEHSAQHEDDAFAAFDAVVELQHKIEGMKA